MPATTSNIRAYVRWRDQSVYAGEEIECMITFKNVAQVQDDEQGGVTGTANQNGNPPERLSTRQPSTTYSRRSSIAQGMATTRGTPSSARPGQSQRGHKPALSLSVVSGPTKGGLRSATVQGKTYSSTVQPAAGHGRSLSIMSMGSENPSEGRAAVTAPIPQRPFRSHGRSASLQIVSKPSVQGSPAIGGISPRQPSPLYESTTPPAVAEAQNGALPVKPVRKRPQLASTVTSPQLGRHNGLRRSPAFGTLDTQFQFPATQPQSHKQPTPQPEGIRRSPANMHSGQQRGVSPRPPDLWSGGVSSLNPISRVMSETSTAGTPRSSSEFYSMSNHSDETLTSEAQPFGSANNRLPKPIHSRQTSSILPRAQTRPALTETLMMGYAQTMGYFTLDSSLVNAAPFEEVKRKGVQGGGGVVGVEQVKRSSSMFGAFSWGNIGESIGGLLGGDEKSSLAQMKASAGSKSIPLLSTPQNLLFVDLRLAPGESRSYNYKFSLPRGLPPSHRGRAMRVFYHLSLGIQRPEAQSVRHVQIPFRVLGSYNARGETLGHDLMSPYILLQDSARSTSITQDPTTPSDYPPFAAKAIPKQSKQPKQGLEDFLRYTERLLDQPQEIHGALASPTSPVAPRKLSAAEQPPANIKDIVDFAILRSNRVGSQRAGQTDGTSANRFNIARGGRPVAVLNLLRPAYRLGEAVTGIIDFTNPPPEADLRPAAATYSVVIELESAEKIDASIAIRSGSSINRVTRKVHASMRENTLYARQISFALGVPAAATPTFETTGISLVWRLKVEFTTERQVQGLGLEGVAEDSTDLLEEIGDDERGTTYIAKEKLLADVFEIEVPLNIYGVPDADAMSTRLEALQI